LTPLPGIVDRPLYLQAKRIPLPGIIPTARYPRSDATRSTDADLPASTTTLRATNVLGAEDDPFGLGFGSITIYPVSGKFSPQSAATSTSNLTKD
jgi:hypothetical protein